MKRILLLLLLCSIFYSCNNNFLNLKYKKHFAERDIILSGNASNYKLYQEISTRNRKSNLYYQHIFTIEIIDSLEFKKKNRIINIEKDSSIIKVFYNPFLIRSAQCDTFKITGTIKTLSFNHNRIKIKERIIIENINDKKTRYMKGRRTFKRE